MTKPKTDLDYLQKQNDYLNQRKAERSDWFFYLQYHKIATLEQLNIGVEQKPGHDRYLKIGWKQQQAALARQMEQVQAELEPLNEVRYWGSRVLGEEQLAMLDKAESKQSVVEQLHKTGEKSKTSRREKSRVKANPPDVGEIGD